MGGCGRRPFGALRAAFWGTPPPRVAGPSRGGAGARGVEGGSRGPRARGTAPRPRPVLARCKARGLSPKRTSGSVSPVPRSGPTRSLRSFSPLSRLREAERSGGAGGSGVAPKKERTSTYAPQVRCHPRVSPKSRGPPSLRAPGCGDGGTSRCVRRSDPEGCDGGGEGDTGPTRPDGSGRVDSGRA